MASDIQCVGDETDIVMECNGIKTGKVKELSKPYEKLSVLVHNEEKLELECSTSVKMKFKDKDDSKLWVISFDSKLCLSAEIEII